MFLHRILAPTNSKAIGKCTEPRGNGACSKEDRQVTWLIGIGDKPADYPRPDAANFAASQTARLVHSHAFTPNMPQHRVLLSIAAGTQIVLAFSSILGN
jgi:hypothetical protein